MLQMGAPPLHERFYVEIPMPCCPCRHKGFRAKPFSDTTCGKHGILFLAGFGRCTLGLQALKLFFFAPIFGAERSFPHYASMAESTIPLYPAAARRCSTHFVRRHLRFGAAKRGCAPLFQGKIDDQGHPCSTAYGMALRVESSRHLRLGAVWACAAAWFE
jgi:hypothetical protein